MAKEQASWTHGYRTDSEYTFGIYPFLNPDNLLLTLALQGIRPAADIVSSGGDDGRRLVYCELGSGQGMTLNLMAARDPGGHYFGVDYNPNQIRNARAFAEAAGIANVKFAEESFADLDKFDIPDCDVIALHGIWSWIDRSMQDCIVQFIKRKLKPGGIVFISYNCAVGRSADVPMRRLMLALEATSAQSEQVPRINDVIDVAQAFSEAGANYFKANPASAQRLKALKQHQLNYVEQEYLNGSWQNYFFDQVAEAMSDAKLDYVGSSNMANNRLEMALPGEAHNFLKRLKQPSDVELLKDMWINNTFRQDIYVRGTQRLSPAELTGLLEPLSFSLAKRREDCKLEVQVPGGKANIPEKPYGTVLDSLAKGVLTGKQIADVVKKDGSNLTLDGVIGALIAVGFISLAPNKSASKRIAQSLSGFENAVHDLVAARHERFTGVIPGLATTVQLSAIDYFFWAAYRRKVKKKSEWIYNQLTAIGRSVVQDGKPVADKAKAIELIDTFGKSFDNGIKPLMGLGQKT